MEKIEKEFYTDEDGIKHEVVRKNGKAYLHITEVLNSKGKIIKVKEPFYERCCYLDTINEDAEYIIDDSDDHDFDDDESIATHIIDDEGNCIHNPLYEEKNYDDKGNWIGDPEYFEYLKKRYSNGDF